MEPHPDAVVPDAASVAASEPGPAPAAGPAPGSSPPGEVLDDPFRPSGQEAALEPPPDQVETPSGFLSPAPPRRGFESALVRLIATAGVIGIGTAVGAILVANHVTGWITGLVVSTLSVVLAAVLWRSRRL